MPRFKHLVEMPRPLTRRPRDEVESLHEPLPLLVAFVSITLLLPFLTFTAAFFSDSHLRMPVSNTFWYLYRIQYWMKDVDIRKSSWTTFVVSVNFGQKSWEASLIMCWPKFLTATSRLLPSELRSHATPMTNMRKQPSTCDEIKHRAHAFRECIY
jgi:hypothetical protein